MPKPDKTRLSNRSFLLPILALLAVAALAVGIAPRYPTNGSDPRIEFTQVSPNSNSPFRDLVDAFAPQSTTFGPNIRANQDATTYGQHEPSLAVSRVNTNTVIVASKDYRDGNVKHVWIDGSTDGGVTWPVQLQMPGIPAPLNIQSDPVVVARDDGRIYVAVLATNDGQTSGGIFITWTDDNGTTWVDPSVPVWYPKNGLDDKEWFAIDNNPASPYYHRMYMMYVPFAGPYSGTVVEQHSTDGGLTWTARQEIGLFNTEYNYPVVASDGTVYDFMMQNWGPSQTGTILMTKSTDGGVTWSSPSPVATAEQPGSPIRSGDNFRFFAILSAAVDPNNGHLYVAWTDDRNFNTNGTDVVYVKSTDGGATWSPQPIRLSHDPTGVVRDHHTPVITIGADSRIHAFWMDRRLDPTNRFFDEWYSSSTDGGATWEPDVRVSTASQDLDIGFPPGSGNAAGDYWGLDTHLDTVYVAWNDTRTGEQDILVSRGHIASSGGPTATPTSTLEPSATATSTSTSTSVSTETSTSIVPSETATVSTPAVTSTNTTTTGPTSTPTLVPVTGCNPVWSPLPTATLPYLHGVVALSHYDAWAVGDGGILRWNGTSWNPVAVPTPPGDSLHLRAISSRLDNDIWAAGYYQSGTATHSIVYHWDGVSWNLVYAEPTGGTQNVLHGISATGAGAAVAVGYNDDQGAPPIILQCNESTCTEMPQPVLDGGLMAIDGNSLNSAWAVGYGVGTSLVQRYTGGAWQVVPSPNIGILNGVLVLAPNDVWAVGDGGAMHWDGTSWTQNATFPGAMAVTGLNSTDIWAVTNNTDSDNIFHWNGSQWTGYYHTDVPLFSISAFSADDVWAVGSAGYIARYRAPQQFEDVLPGSTFYSFIQDLSCEGIVSGYPCGTPNEPCHDPARPYFRPQNDVTRGQLSKIVALSAGITNPFEVQTFEDVPINSTFWEYVEALAFRNAISGYPCGGPNEPCGPGNKPYFRPNATSTRGQTSKIVAVTKGYTDPFQDQTFEDVPVGSTFHTWIENLAQRGIINGYPCGGPNEPCGPGNKPYFRPGNLVTRGQMSKIAVITFFP